jgi:predicted component of type VI protein secretion system
MSPSTLHELLAALHAKLGERQQLSARDRELTHAVMSDLRRVLGGDSATAATPPHGLAAQVVRLEAAHPDLVPVIRRIVDLLGKAGV